MIIYLHDNRYGIDRGQGPTRKIGDMALPP